MGERVGQRYLLRICLQDFLIHQTEGLRSVLEAYDPVGLTAQNLILGRGH